MPRAPTLKETYPIYSPPPSGYIAWHHWARAQAAHGLKQKRCRTCGRYCFPQEMGTHSCEAFMGVKGKEGKAKGLRG